MSDTIAVPDTVDAHAQAIFDGLVAFKGVQTLVALFRDQDDYFDPGTLPYCDAIRATTRAIEEEITSDNGCDSWDVDYAIQLGRELVALVRLSQLEGIPTGGDDV